MAGSDAARRGPVSDGIRPRGADGDPDGAVTSVFQPIVELDSGRVVAHDALARGPEGPLRAPDALFAAARAEGRLTELDQACRAATLRGAVQQGLLPPLTDVTARVQAERALQTEQDRCRDVETRPAEFDLRLPVGAEPAGWVVQRSTDSPGASRA